MIHNLAQIVPLDQVAALGKILKALPDIGILERLLDGSILESDGDYQKRILTQIVQKIPDQDFAKIGEFFFENFDHIYFIGKAQVTDEELVLAVVDFYHILKMALEQESGTPLTKGEAIALIDNPLQNGPKILLQRGTIKSEGKPDHSEEIEQLIGSFKENHQAVLLKAMVNSLDINKLMAKDWSSSKTLTGEYCVEGKKPPKLDDAKVKKELIKELEQLALNIGPKDIDLILQILSGENKGFHNLSKLIEIVQKVPENSLLFTVIVYSEPYKKGLATKGYDAPWRNRTAISVALATAKWGLRGAAAVGLGKGAKSSASPNEGERESSSGSTQPRVHTSSLSDGAANTSAVPPLPVKDTPTKGWW